MTRAVLFAALALNLTPFACRAGAVPPSLGAMDLAAIPTLDLTRYAGRWYEIAKFPNRFQRQCLADTTAEYRLLVGGGVEVVNRCRTGPQAFDEAIGAARLVGGPGSAKLKVRFAPAWLSFLDAVWGDYWVVDIDEGYQLAAVSEPKREYLWVLSRTPQVDAAIYAALVGRLRAMGFDTARLELGTHAAGQ